MSEKIGHRDVLYLFGCHLEWRTKRKLAAYQELIEHSTIKMATIGALQTSSCTEARQGGANCDLCRILVKERPFRVEKRVASYLQFWGQVHNDNPGVELKGAISRHRIRCILAMLAGI